MFTLFADITMLFHLAVGVYVLLGGFLCLRNPKYYVLHLLPVLISLSIDFSQVICPITALERYFRAQAGNASLNTVTFLDQYFSWLSFTSDQTSFLTPSITFAILTIFVNLVIYTYVIKKRKAIKSQIVLDPSLADIPTT